MVSSPQRRCLSETVGARGRSISIAVVIVAVAGGGLQVRRGAMLRSRR